MYCAYVTRIHNLRKHTNADRLLCGECFGNTVIVDLGTDPDQLGVYFPTDGKLGLEFAQKNDLLRRKDENGAPAGGYLDPEKRNIKALKLRGEKSDGLFLPLSCLASFTDIKKLHQQKTEPCQISCIYRHGTHLGIKGNTFFYIGINDVLTL